MKKNLNQNGKRCENPRLQMDNNNLMGAGLRSSMQSRDSCAIGGVVKENILDNRSGGKKENRWAGNIGGRKRLDMGGGYRKGRGEKNHSEGALEVLPGKKLSSLIS